MSLLRQTWTLTRKNLTLVVLRHWFWTFIRALAFPIVLAVVVGNTKNWLNSGGEYGIGNYFPVRTLADALENTPASHSRVIFIDNGLTGSDVQQVIANLSDTFQQSGREVLRFNDATDLATTCYANLQGVTNCWAAINFFNSPQSGEPGSIWDYTIFFDSALGGSPSVYSNDNDAQLYSMPLQHALDSAIAATNSSATQLPTTMQQSSFTYESQAEFEEATTAEFQSILVNYLLVVFFIAICGITYHLPGFMALEREQGLTQLIDAMIPTRSRLQAQIVRYTALHLAFDIVYIPGWIIVGVLVGHYAFPATNLGYLVLFHFLTGLSLCSGALFMGSFFRKAQLSGVTSVIITAVLAIAAQYGVSPSLGTTGEVIALGLLFPPMTYIFLLELVGYYQAQGLPIDLSGLPFATYGWNWSVTGSTLIGFLVVQIVVYPVLAIWVERGLFGVSGKGRTILHGKSPPFAVQLQNVFIEYKAKSSGCCGGRNKGSMVKAVNNLSLNWLPGSITVLLGVNGSGKSTVLNAISGLKEIKSGSIEVDSTGGFGLCPQKNVLFPNLTVYEHVKIFSSLKNTSSASPRKSEIESLISSCDLTSKRNALSKTLSGGQKRKLQLAMMFAGGSKVCCIDEVTSGVDPLARRKIWDILLAKRGEVTLLMTTHYLEEADVLADYVAIMSKGSMKVQGSTVELKNALGGGYHVIVGSRVPDSIRITSNPSSYDGPNTIYTAEDPSGVADILTRLEENNIRDYRVHEPTTENVFLQVADELNDDPDEVINSNPKHDAKRTVSVQSATGMTEHLDLTVGTGTSFFKQTMILLQKRFIIARSNYMPYLAALFVPLCTAGLVTLFFKHSAYPDGIKCSDTSGRDLGYLYTGSPYPLLYDEAVYGPPQRLNPDVFVTSIPDYSADNFSSLNTVPSFGAFNDVIRTNASYLYYGGFYNDPQKPSIAWMSSGYTQLYEVSSIQSIANQFITQIPIRASWSTFGKNSVPRDTDKTIQLSIYTALALCVYPALFALYPTLERRRGVRALHYSNGIRSGPLWIAYFLFDLIFVLIISALIPVIWTTQWNGWFGLGHLFVVLTLYGMTSIAFSYCVSLFVSSQLAAFAASAGLQALLCLLYFVSYITSQVYAPPGELQNWLDYEYFTIALVTPAGSMLRSLLLSVNSYFVLCRGTEQISYPGRIDAYGGPILYLIVQFILLVTFLMYWDAGWRPTLFRSKRHAAIDPESQASNAITEASEDPARLKPSSSGVQINHVTKRYGSLTAIEDISLGLRRSESISLLGANGGGKTTLLNTIQGALRPSNREGSIIIEGHDILTQRTAARAHLGVCNQFDAMDAMTVEQQLAFYARARGVPKADVQRNVVAVMNAFKLTQYSKRFAAKLSGGNQRKLSLACALVGGPTVLLLDEPSTGLDPKARRILWRELAHISAGRVLVLSTHSMEEADALCDRAAILARRILALGTTDDLRDRHGAMHVHIVHQQAPHASPEAMHALKQWVYRQVPGAHVEDRTYSGQLRFSVPMRHNDDEVASDGQTVAGLFSLMERWKDELGIAYYSVGRTTLDDVFLSVVRKNHVEEENYAHVERSGWRRMIKWK